MSVPTKAIHAVSVATLLLAAACGGRSVDSLETRGGAGAPAQPGDGAVDAAPPEERPNRPEPMPTPGPTDPPAPSPLPSPVDPPVDTTPPDPNACARRCPDAMDFQIASPASEADRVFNAVLDEHLGQLYGRIGKYACSEDAVYEGSFDARDDVGEAYGNEPYESNRMSGPVVGSVHVEWPPPWNGSAKLTLISTEQSKHLVLEQDPERPERTEGTNVADFSDSHLYNRAGCYDCAPPIADIPELFAVDGLVATGITVKWTLTASGSLSLVPAELVSVAHLSAIGSRSPATREFFSTLETDGTRRSKTVSDTFIEYVDVLAARWDSCSMETEYQIDQHFEASCPADYGVGNLRILSQQTCCTETLDCPPDRSGCNTNTECFPGPTP